MPAPRRRSNRFVGYTALFAAVSLGTVYQFVLKPVQEQMRRAARNGVVSAHEAILTPDEEHRNVKMEHRLQLRKAIQQGNWQMASTLFATGIDINSDIGGMTPLMTAAKYGITEIIHKLLDADAAVDKQDQFGNTALLYAARCGQQDAVKTLLEGGANLKAHNQMGAGALDLAIIGRHHKLYEFFKAEGVPVNLCQAISAEDDTLLRKLLAQGANVNALYPSGNPLTSTQSTTGLTVSHLNFTTTETEIFFEAYRTQTPLETALTVKRLSIAEFLLAHGANINQKDRLGWTPLMTAANRNNVEAVQFLLHYHARTDIKTKEGKEIFSLLAFRQTPQGKEIERLLREARAKSP